jgi:hypothetical protein
MGVSCLIKQGNERECELLSTPKQSSTRANRRPLSHVLSTDVNPVLYRYVRRDERQHISEGQAPSCMFARLRALTEEANIPRGTD